MGKQLLHHHKIAASLILVGVIFLFAGCGSDKSAKEGPAGQQNIGSEGKPAESQAAPLKIGIFYPLTGTASEYGVMIQEGQKIARDVVNERGGVNGGQVVLELQDTQGKPEQALAALRKLAGMKDVAVAVGPQRTAEALRASPLAAELKIPIVTGSVTEWPEKPSKWTFKPGLIESLAYPSILDTLKSKMNLKTVAIIYAYDDDYEVFLAKAFKKVLEDKGISITSEQTFKLGDLDFSAQLTKIKAANPDLLFIATLLKEQGSIIKQAKSRDIKASLLISTGNPDVIKLAGSENAQDLYLYTPYNPNDDRPIAKEFHDRYIKIYNREPNTWQAFGYDDIMLVVDAAKRAGTNIDRQAIRDALAQTKGFPAVNGKSKSFGPDAGDNLDQKMYLMQYKGDKFYIVD